MMSHSEMGYTDPELPSAWVKNVRVGCGECGREFFTSNAELGRETADWKVTCPECGSADLLNLGGEMI